LQNRRRRRRRGDLLAAGFHTRVISPKARLDDATLAKPTELSVNLFRILDSALPARGCISAYDSLSRVRTREIRKSNIIEVMFAVQINFLLSKFHLPGSWLRRTKS